jgi:tripartite-type tricarboxylate transporter receptor subunit TctC
MLALLAALPGGATAQSWPARSIRVLVGFAPGGLTDVVTRIYAQALNDRLGQAVVVENRTGAGGNVATEAVAKAQPDGYTLLGAFDGTFTINPHLYPRLAFDPLRDFAPVAKLADVPVLIVGHPSLPARTLAEVVEHARANPGAVTFATGGVGTTGHLLGEWICQSTGVSMTHVPFRGGGQAVAEVVAGRVSIMLAGVTAGRPFVQSGQLRGLAVASALRSPVLPEVSTMQEQGFSGVDVSSWAGLMAPARTPAEVLARLRAEVSAILREAATVVRLREQGGTPGTTDGDAFLAQIAAESDRWREVIRRAGIRADG